MAAPKWRLGYIEATVAIVGLGLGLYSTGALGQSYFGSYPCTSDCSGHEAGYNWAEQKGIDQADDCGGNSRSFIEGCRAYVEENYGDDDEDEDVDDDEEGNDLDDASNE